MIELVSLELGFENCEVYTFPYNEVASIDIDQITKSIHKVWRSNHLKKTYESFDTVLIFPPEANHEFNNSTIFKRIHSRKDVTDVTIKDSTGDAYCVRMIWNDSNDYMNKFQTSAFLSDGSLVLVISKERTAFQMKDEIDKKIEEIDEAAKYIKDK